MTSKLTYRVRIPVRTRSITSRRGRRSRLSGGRCMRQRRRLRGGFLPAIIPLIAAAIGAVPGIASVALQASHRQ